MLISKEVEIGLIGSDIKYYENKGYIIPRKKNKYGRLTIPRGTKLKVKVEDLPSNSKANIQYICDYCEEEGNGHPLTLSWDAYNRHKKDIVNKDACSKHSSQKAKDLGTKVNIPKKLMPKEEIVKYYLELANKIQCIPKHRHIKEECKVNPDFPSLRTIQNVFGELTKLKEYCNLETQYFKYSKEELLNMLKEYISMNGIPANRRKVFTSKNGLPAYKTYIFYFGDDLVNLIKLCGYELSEEQIYLLNKRGKPVTTTKSEAINIIYNMQNKLGRPLMYDDFRNPSKDEIGITLVKKYWGSMNKMKEELGLEIIQESMTDKQLTLKEAEQQINLLCNTILNKEQRNIITYKDINKNKDMQNTSSYNKIFMNELGMNLREYVQSIGFDFAQEGTGLNHVFEDGEKTRSQHELDFSIYLRNIHNLKYNMDYQRDVRYKTFIQDYKGLLDCDYVISYKDRLIYIEIAGLLRDYQNWYYQDKPLNSKTKEKYRLKLKEKEDMLKQAGLEYYILFPCDLNEDTYTKIFN